MRAKQINFSGETINNIHMIRMIGQGNWADVYLAESLDSNQKFAVKTTSNIKINEVPKLKQLIHAQIHILKACKNQNVVTFIDSFQYKDHQFIVLEYCNGLELGDVLLREKKIDQPTAVAYLKQILNGFKGLHQVKAMHRDFKVQNVMLHDNICKIVDLGFGKQFHSDGEMARTKLGSNKTMAPQVMQSLPYDFRADIWSIGIVFYQMLFGTYPFNTRTQVGILEKAKKHQYSLSGVEISNSAKDFITKSLKFDPQQRINWEDIYTHPLITDESMEMNIVVESKINVEENALFYLKSSKELEKEIVGHQLMRDKQVVDKLQVQEVKSSFMSFLNHSRGEEKEISELISAIEKEQKLPSIVEPQKIKIAFEAAKIEEWGYQFAEEQRLRQQKMKDIRFQYNKQLQNIRFMSSYIINSIKEFQKNGCQINHELIICLLLKESFLKLDTLNDDLNFGKNTFSFNQSDFKDFLKQDGTVIALILQQNLKNIRYLFSQYKKFISFEDYQDRKLEQILYGIQSYSQFFYEVLYKYIDIYIKQLRQKQYDEKYDQSRCKLIKLNFTIMNYREHNPQENFIKKKVLFKHNFFEQSKEGKFQRKKKRIPFEEYEKQRENKKIQKEQERMKKNMKWRNREQNKKEEEKIIKTLFHPFEFCFKIPPFI